LGILRILCERIITPCQLAVVYPAVLELYRFGVDDERPMSAGALVVVLAPGAVVPESVAAPHSARFGVADPYPADEMILLPDAHPQSAGLAVEQ